MVIKVNANQSGKFRACPIMIAEACTAMARNQPGQKGGNQGPILVVHDKTVIRQEIKDPINRLINNSRIRGELILGNIRMRSIRQKSAATVRSWVTNVILGN